MTESPATSSAEAAEFIEPVVNDAPELEPMPAPEPEPEPDPAAPYGYRADGTPRKSRAGRPPSKKAPVPPAKKATTARKATSPKLVPTGPAVQPGKPTGPAVPVDRAEVMRYAQGVSQVIGFGQKMVIGSALGLKARGADRGATTLLADAAALGMLNGPVSMVAGQLAAENPDHVAVRTLNKLIVAGPYAEAGFAMLVFVGQVAVNHGVIPAGWFPGTKRPDALADSLIRELEEAAAQA